MPRAGSSTIPGALKRYQACHSCRKRKLKWRAGLNSLERAVFFIDDRQLLDPINAPSEPSCVYDSPDLKVMGPKARIAALESEIAELQDLLRIADDRLAQCTCGAAQIPDPHAFKETSSNSSPMPAAPGLQPLGATMESEIEFTFPSPPLPNSNQFLPGPPLALDSPSPHALNPNEEMPQHDSPGSRELTLNIWPLNIPPPAMLFHLVEIFFYSVPLASRLIHKPTFISNLSQPPTSPDFPHVAVLHAICALASLYSPIITQPPRKKPQDGRRVPIFASTIMYRPSDAWGTTEQRYFPRRVEDVLDPVPEGFGAMHARWAAESMKPSVRIGDRALQLLQAAIIITWYHYSMGSLIPLYVWLALMTRFGVPLGMNVAEGFEPLSRLPPEMLYVSKMPKTPIEAETWRNIFWVTYLGYAVDISIKLAYRDDDISQLMPCRFADFISGTFVPTHGRQQLFTDNMLLHHPSLTTDSWTLYIKATILVSRVRVFNARYRIHSKLRREDPTIPPTQAEEFQSLDRTISAFLQSIPRTFRQPVGVTVDALLYMAHLVPHVARIQLHDPHAQLRVPDDYSAIQLLSAAHEILDLIYKISATSFYVAYLDPACGFCWFLAGATITRFLRVKIDAQDAKEVAALTQELGAVKYIILKLGERALMGLRNISLLDELYDKLIRNRDNVVSEAHGASSQPPLQGAGSARSSSGN
ncbi:hypothetical protein FS837_010152 [Tulasnella sp. UAMH 9824]|nr:hypothetical protein FS837_010152 [Tulasnella sp. UAMH 9824]